jgi:hypothetical protein
MATPNIYKSSDTGAPLLTTAQMYTVLKQCLVTGYGSKSGAGWTLAFDDPANKKAVFKNANGDCALRVETTTATVALVFAADDYSDIDTPVGSAWNAATTFSFSNMGTSGSRAWICFATDELFIISIGNANSLTGYNLSTTGCPIYAFGRASARGDSVLPNILLALGGNSSTPTGASAGAVASLSGYTILGACSRDSGGGTSGSRLITQVVGMPARYESSPGNYNAANYVGAAGPDFDLQTRIQAERLTFFREDGSIVGDIPIVMPYARMDRTVYGGDIDSTITLDGQVYSVLPGGNNQDTVNTYARILVPHDGW